MPMTVLTCDECGFDGARWSASDVERTLAHAEDLVGFVLEGARDDVIAASRRNSPIVDGDDAVVATHAVMHRLYELAQVRRANDVFEPMVGEVASLQVSRGGAPKLPIEAARVEIGGLVGDRQANRSHHGRPWQAVCLYSGDRIAALQLEGHPIAAGSTGENLTISGIDWSRLRGGLVVTIGEVQLRTSGPAAPCHKIGDCFIDRQWMRIDHVERPGWARWYASVLTGGNIAQGDTVTVSS